MSPSDGDLQSCAVTVLNLPTSTTKATLAAFFTRRAADGDSPAEHMPHTIRVGISPCLLPAHVACCDICCLASAAQSLRRNICDKTGRSMLRLGSIVLGSSLCMTIYASWALPDGAATSMPCSQLCCREEPRS